MTSLTLLGGGSFSPELGSVIFGGNTEARMAITSRDGLLALRGLFAPVWLPSGLKAFLSLSNSTLAFEAPPAADTLWAGRISLSVSHLGRFGLGMRVDIEQVQSDEGARF